MMPSSPIFEFCYKGSRNYIQGADIVSKILEYYSDNNISNLDVKFNSIVSTNLVLIEGLDCLEAKVNIGLELNGETNYMQFVETSQKVKCRYEYDENQIIDKTTVDEALKQISLSSVTGYTLCENFVAMNKSLLQKLYPEKEGKWYFTRLILDKIIDDDALISVRLIKNFNFRLTKSDILLAEEVIGQIYFTMVKEE